MVLSGQSAFFSCPCCMFYHLMLYQKSGSHWLISASMYTEVGVRFLVIHLKFYGFSA